jgi:hypothetical protein
VQKFTAGAGFADFIMEVEAEAAASDQVAGHALKAGRLRKGWGGREGGKVSRGYRKAQHDFYRRRREKGDREGGSETYL